MSLMSNFFEKSDLSRKEAESIISDTLQKCDDGELYLENSISELIFLDDNKNKNSLSEYLQKVQTEDLIRYGLIPEFLGRLPVMAILEELDHGALVRIMSEPKNAILKQYEELFALDHVDVEFTKEAVSEIAKKAIKRKLGARGLRSLTEKILMDTMYEIPSMNNVDKVVIDENVVNQEAEPLLVLAGNQEKNKKEGL